MTRSRTIKKVSAPTAALDDDAVADFLGKSFLPRRAAEVVTAAPGEDGWAARLLRRGGGRFVPEGRVVAAPGDRVAVLGPSSGGARAITYVFDDDPDKNY